MRHKETTERGAGARTAGTLTRPRAQTEGAGPQQAHATWTMVLRAWDADPEFDEPAGDEWLCILPKKWNKQQLCSYFTAGATIHVSSGPMPLRSATRTRPLAHPAYAYSV